MNIKLNVEVEFSANDIHKNPELLGLINTIVSKGGDYASQSATTVAPSTITEAPTTASAPPVTTTITQPPTSAPITQPTAYTLEQLSVAAASLMDAGKSADLISALQGLGVQSLAELPKEQYGEFATVIRGMGANI